MVIKMANKKSSSTIKIKQNVYNPDEEAMKNSKAILNKDKAFYKFYNMKGTQFFIRHIFVILAFLIPFLVMLAIFIKNEVYPAGDKQLLIIDFWHQYFPFTSEMQDKLQNGGSLLYSLRSGWGQNFLGIMSYYTASPLNFLSLLIPETHLREFLALFVCIKVGCAGLFMGMYLKHVFKRNDFSVVLFSIPYALCAYIVGYYWNIMWLDTVALMPLVALGVHFLIKQGKFKLYTISLAVAFFSNFYIGFFLCIFVALYFIAEVICLKLSIKNILIKLWQILLFSIIGIALTAILILPAYLALKLTYSSGNSSFPEQMTFYKDFKEVLGNLLAFQTPTHLEGLPNLYCSLLAVMMIGVHALSKKISIREKVVTLLLLSFLIISCNNNFLDYIWHGFHFTNQIPFRFSFIFAFVLLVTAYRAFTQLEKISVFHVIGAAAAAGGILVIGLLSDNVSNKVITNNVALALGYLALITILLVKYKYINTKTVALVMIIPMIIETYNSANNLFKDNNLDLSTYSTYYDKNDEVQKLLTKIEPADDDFYRTEMSKWYTINDPCLYRYYGVSQFSSMSNSSVTAYMENLGVVSQLAGNRYYYGATSPFTNALLNLKYVISKTGTNSDTYLKEIDDVDGVKLYENTAYMPFGFMTESGLKDFKLNNPDNPFYYLNALFTSMTGIDKELYSYVVMTKGEAENATITNEDDATGMYGYVPGEEHGTSLFKGEKALNISKNDVEGVKAQTYYQLMPEKLIKILNPDNEKTISQKALKEKQLYISFTYQEDENAWNDDSEYRFVFYTPAENSDEDPDMMTVEDEYDPGQPFEFKTEITEEMLERGLVIEGFGVVLNEVSVVDATDDTQTDSSNETATFKFNYKVDSDSMLYGFIKTPIIENVDTKISSDDQTYSYTVEDDLEYVFPVGFAKAGDTATVSGTTKEALKASGDLFCFVYKINDDVLKEGLNKLKANGTYNITERSDTYFKGEIDAKTDGYMYTAIPANGWTAYVDGEKAETAELCDAVLGVKLNKGKHTVELKYTPPGFIAGILISAAGLVLLVFMSIFVKKRSPKCFESLDVLEEEHRLKRAEKEAAKAELKAKKKSIENSEPKDDLTDKDAYYENSDDESKPVENSSDNINNEPILSSDNIQLFDSEGNEIELESPEIENDPDNNK